MGAPNTLTRRTVPAGKCDWCGQYRIRLYAYGGLPGAFCNVVDADLYHGGIEYDYLEFRKAQES